MFTVDNYRVEFSYYDLAKPKKRSRVVICDIYGVAGSLMSTGQAFCSREDQFNKNTGRKIALGRALKNLFPYERNMRAMFWQAYFDKRGKVD